MIDKEYERILKEYKGNEFFDNLQDISLRINSIFELLERGEYKIVKENFHEDNIFRCDTCIDPKPCVFKTNLDFPPLYCPYDYKKTNEWKEGDEKQETFHEDRTKSFSKSERSMILDALENDLAHVGYIEDIRQSLYREFKEVDEK